jgi:GNAT superfamily N-acetyltransferase
VLEITVAHSDEDIGRCLPVMKQLRPHLSGSESEFVDRIRLQMSLGFRLAFLAEGGEVRAVAGFRTVENLSRGRMLYVDDLVTDEAHRSSGHGAKMLLWLADRAREDGCSELHLDSGVQRVDAHRFYLAHGMVISAHHFQMKV